MSHRASWGCSGGFSVAVGCSAAGRAQRGRRPFRVRVCACVCVCARRPRIASVPANWILLLFFIIKCVPLSVSRSVSRSVPLAVSWMARKSPAAGGFAVPFAVPLAVPQGVPLAVSWPCLLGAGGQADGRQRVGRASAWRCLLAAGLRSMGDQAACRQRVGSVSAGGRLEAPWGAARDCWRLGLAGTLSSAAHCRLGAPRCMPCCARVGLVSCRGLLASGPSVLASGSGAGQGAAGQRWRHVAGLQAAGRAAGRRL